MKGKEDAAIIMRRIERARKPRVESDRIIDIYPLYLQTVVN